LGVGTRSKSAVWRPPSVHDGGFPRPALALSISLSTLPILLHLPKRPHEANAEADCDQQKEKGPIGFGERVHHKAPLRSAGLDPPMLVPPHVGEVLLTRMIVKEADDECPHDRAPLFDEGDGGRSLFHVSFVDCGKWFRRTPVLKSNHRRAALPSRAAAGSAGNPGSPQIPDSPAAFLESCRGHAAAGSRRRVLIFVAQAYEKRRLRSGISFGLRSGPRLAVEVLDCLPLS
jgi:hypothetical protein